MFKFKSLTFYYFHKIHISETPMAIHSQFSYQCPPPSSLLARKIEIENLLLFSINIIPRPSTKNMTRLSISSINLTLLLALVTVTHSLTRQDLLDHLKYAQETRNTFDSRIRQGDYMKPIGYVAGKPIWPRVLDRVRSTGELFFDDDNIAYVVHDRNPAGMIRKMDKEKNFETVMQFLDKYTL
ncbi:hypothetical protein CRE_06916 [Caenorhabditis remanei]|uniref:Uncharacterized protein n=1 Tax=Caenorhabditis remanei TaxID=31234 RepID=E3MZL6_CAERE|nr:hypothetical protein CRE_06916 [Caenorhabditis remanei]